MFKGYGVLDERGTLIWGSLRIRAADAEAWFHRHNPAPDSHARRPVIVPVKITLGDRL